MDKSREIRAMNKYRIIHTLDDAKDHMGMALALLEALHDTREVGTVGTISLMDSISNLKRAYKNTSDTIVEVQR